MEEDAHDHDVGGLQHSGEAHDENEHHGEKKSVLKKVKAKAKKIKDTIKGHVGHGHELDQGHDHDDDDDEDDEMDTDSEMHGSPTAQGAAMGKQETGRQHGTATGATVGVVPVSNPGGYQTFVPTTTHYVPGQEETLEWSRTDIGRPLGTEDQPYAPKNTPAAAHSGGSLGTGDLGIGHKPKLGGILEKDLHVSKDAGEDVRPANYQANVTNPAGSGYSSAAAQSLVPGLGSGGAARQHGSYMEERGTTEGASHVPVSKPVEYQTFDTTTSRYVPGRDETLGWSRTDTGRVERSDERPYAPKNTPIDTHLGRPHGTGVLETRQEGESGKLGGILERPPGLEKDPHAPRDAGEKRPGENSQSKVTDPTGKGSEEIGVTPILHQLSKMNIHDEPNPTATAGQQESLFNPGPRAEKLSTGSHDQFSPEPDIRETRTHLQSPESESQLDNTRPSGQVFHDEPEQKQGSYTEKISSAASMVADKAKQATTAVTSKLGYGGAEQHSTAASTGPLAEQPVHGPLDKEPVPGGYGERLSSVKTAIADTAIHAKDVVASKLGYGATHEDQPTNVQRSATEHEHDVGSAANPDKGVSVKEYLVEKLKPGEEDKALSEMITEALPLHKRKEDVSHTGEGEKKVEIKAIEIKGRVTDSEEVANRLGRSDETNYDGLGPGLASPGKGVMDRIYDAAGSWFRKGGDQTGPTEHTAEGNEGGTQNSSSRETQQNQVVGEPGLQ